MHRVEIMISYKICTQACGCHCSQLIKICQVDEEDVEMSSIDVCHNRECNTKHVKDRHNPSVNQVDQTCLPFLPLKGDFSRMRNTRFLNKDELKHTCDLRKSLENLCSKLFAKYFFSDIFGRPIYSMEDC